MVGVQGGRGCELFDILYCFPFSLLYFMDTAQGDVQYFGSGKMGRWMHDEMMKGGFIIGLVATCHIDVEHDL